MSNDNAKVFNCSNCGECCGPIPVNELELGRIRRALSRMPVEKINRLKNQQRDSLTCIFRDMESNTCSIYNMRPELCKMFGYYEGMVCSRNEEHATKSREEGMRRITKGGKAVGVLTMQINWDNIFTYKAAAHTITRSIR